MRDFAASGTVVGYLSAVYFYAYALMQISVGGADGSLRTPSLAERRRPNCRARQRRLCGERGTSPRFARPLVVAMAVKEPRGPARN
jgi:hypothetical protein